MHPTPAEVPDTSTRDTKIPRHSLHPQGSQTCNSEDAERHGCRGDSGAKSHRGRETGGRGAMKRGESEELLGKEMTFEQSLAGVSGGDAEKVTLAKPE